MSDFAAIPCEPTPEIIEAMCKAYAEPEKWPDDFGEMAIERRRARARKVYAVIVTRGRP